MSLDPVLSIPARFKTAHASFLKPTSKAPTAVCHTRTSSNAGVLRFRDVEIDAGRPNGMEQGWLGLPESRSAGDNPKDCQIFDERRTFSWWIARVPTLTPEERNGWVLSLIMEEFTQEQHFVDACNMKTFEQRMIESGMQSLLDVNTPPRKRCSKLN